MKGTSVDRMTLEKLLEEHAPATIQVAEENGEKATQWRQRENTKKIIVVQLPRS